MIDTLVTTTGQPSINIPQITNKAQPTVLTIRNLVTFFIINEINKAAMAAYPNQSTKVNPKTVVSIR